MVHSENFEKIGPPGPIFSKFSLFTTSALWGGWDPGPGPPQSRRNNCFQKKSSKTLSVLTIFGLDHICRPQLPDPGLGHVVTHLALGPGPGPWPPGQALGLIAFALWGDGTWPWALAPGPGPGPNFHKFAQIPGSQPVVHSRILQKIGPQQNFAKNRASRPDFCCYILLLTTFQP